ncbi:hypothetical protein QR680_005076 [Steinernema hermaphroditum]|uniref:BZIP domain-containing protein n=1 Tax=Steinernema hermaphroditum TaxID=289476 RepID=A0AA39LUQ2_9BILA|nr:hypothetical protein QR680_005076 [Steinernema hermaphroditum]
MYQQPKQLQYDNVSEVLRIEDWSFPDGNDFFPDGPPKNLPVVPGSSPLVVNCTPAPTAHPITVPVPVHYSSYLLQHGVARPPVQTEDLPCSSVAEQIYESRVPGLAKASGPYVVQEKPLVAKHRRLANQRAAEEREAIGPVRRRGRPMKSTSSTKSALYAREYRMQNKQLLEQYKQQVDELIEENRVLKENRVRMHEKYHRLKAEFEQVNEVNRKLQSEMAPHWASGPSMRRRGGGSVRRRPC